MDESLSSWSNVVGEYNPDCIHILVTGGAGYIGSHTCLVLLEAGYEVTVIDSFANSKAESLRRVGELTSKTERIHVLNADIRDEVSCSDTPSQPLVSMRMTNVLRRRRWTVASLQYLPCMLAFISRA